MAPDHVEPARDHEAYDRIRPHVRRTPVVDIDAAELGLAPAVARR